VNVRPKLTAAVLFMLVAGLAALLPAAVKASEPIEPPTLTVTAAPSTLTCGAVTTLTAKGSPPGAELTLSRKRAGEIEFTVVASAIADSGGEAQWKRTPPTSTVFRVAFADAATHGTASAEVSVGVRPKVTLAAASRKPLLENRYVRYTVKVRPAHPGATVQLARWTAGDWVAFKDVTLGDDSQATVRVLAGKPGRLIVRAEMAADVDHLSGRSPLWKVTVFDKRNPYGTPTRFPHLILVDLSKYKLYYHEHGNIVRVFDCVLGRPSLPTPRGHYKIYAKDPHMGGPYGPFRMRYLGLYAIHGTNEPWLLARFPRNYSHGCTRLANANITWLYSRVHVGTPVWNVP
jgi:hypothetical protein